MKNKIVAVVVFFLLTNFVAKAQQSFDSPIQYLEFINKYISQVDEDMWDYSATIAHTKKLRKIENRRKDLINSITDAQSHICQIKYKPGKQFRDSTCFFLETYLNMLNDEYSKIVDMEEISENSYTSMEAYFNAMEEADAKLNETGKIYDRQYKKFAEENNITLIAKKDKMSEKVKKANKIFKQQHKLYLIFFHSFKEESLMLEGMNKSSTKLIKMHRDSLNDIAKLGLVQLKALKTIEGDIEIKAALTDLLNFYIYESGDKSKTLVNYYVKKKKLAKLKDAMEESEDKENRDAYNEAVKAMNDYLVGFNAFVDELNTKRTDKTGKWNQKSSEFLDKNVPKRK
jgi:hypothetical protein